MADRKNVSEKQMEKMVDLALEFKGVERDELFEYPYTDRQSNDMLRSAEALVKRILRLADKEQTS